MSMTTHQVTKPLTIQSRWQWTVVLAAACLIAFAPPLWSALGIGLFGAALVALVVPWLPWVILAGLLPFLTALRLSAGTPADLFLAGCIALWFAAGVAKRSLVVTAVLPISAVFVYILAQLFALIPAADLGEGLVEVVKWGEFAVVLLVVPNVLGRRHVGWLIAGLLTAAAIQGILGLYQFINRIGPEWFLIQDRFMRASGTFRQPNPYAGYLGLTLPIAFGITLWAITHWWQQRSMVQLTTLLSALVALGAIGIGLMTSWSRGGWLGALVGGIVVMLLFSRATRRISFIAGAVALVGVLVGAVNPAWVPSAIVSRIADLPAMVGAGDVLNQPVTDENFAVIERLAHWVAALRMWDSNLWLGVGPGNYSANYASVALPRWPEALGHAHNIYLNVLAESGLIGFISFCVMWAALAIWVIRQIQTAHNEASEAMANTTALSHALAVGSLGMLAHLAVHSLFDNLFVQGIYLQIAFWLACLAALSTAPDHRITASSESRELD